MYSTYTFNTDTTSPNMNANAEGFLDGIHNTIFFLK
jgi:hypothetical protein